MPPETEEPGAPPLAPPQQPADAVRTPAADGQAVRGLRAEGLEFAPATYDAERGEVDVVFSTGADVDRVDWWSGERFVESLDLAGADLGRLQAGAPLLLDHAASVRNVVGSVVPGSARIVGGVGLARVRFDRSSPEGVAAEGKVAGGHLRFVSIGYRVSTWEKTTATAGAAARWIARAWSPHEISLVAVPADAGAGARALPGPEATTTTTTNRPAAGAARGGKPMPPEMQTEQTVPPVDAAAVRAEAIAAERGRVAMISDRVRELGLDAGVGEAMVRDGVDGPAIAERLLAELAARSRRVPAAPIGAPSNEDPAQVRAAMVEAIAASVAPDYKPAHARAAEFRGWRPSHYAGELLRQAGQRVPHNPAELAERSFHSTSDFPNLLAAAANKVLLQQYEQASPAYRRVMGRKNFRDFKAHSFLRVGDFPALEKIGETGEIKAGTMGENKETVTLATYGKRMRLTRQVIINDDLGAFGDFSSMIGRRITDFEDATAFGVMALNSGDGPNLTDAARVFTTGRGNKAGSATAITNAAIGLGRRAMRVQKSMDGLVLNLNPAILLCSPDKETEAETILTPVAATQGSTINLFAGRLQAVSDANLVGNGWYLFADPATAPVYVYGYLDGASGPMVSTGPVQGVDGVEISLLLDFAVGAVDFRGGYFNAGA